MDLDTTTTVFIYNGMEYRLQAWNGEYMFGIMAGGEIALYARPLYEALENPYLAKDLEDYAHRLRSLSTHEVNNLFINHRSLASEADQIPMVLYVYDNDGNRIIRNDTAVYANEGTHYWNYAAVPNSQTEYSRDDLYVVGELTIEDDGLRDAMQQALLRDGIDVILQGDGQTLKVIW